jgi:hypothetical protein
MEKKTFAFKLSDANTKGASKWNAREGVALAGCTEYRFPGNYRYSDNGVYC